MALAREKAEEMHVKARGTELEKRLFEALSSENWGASSSLLNQIAQDTYDYEKYPIIMKQVWSAMSSTATNWRKVFKVGRYAFPFKIFLLIIFANVESFLLES